MPNLTIYGDELIDREPEPDKDGMAVRVPEAWESTHVKLVYIGSRTHEFELDGQEAVKRVPSHMSGSMYVSVPESWNGEEVMVVRTGVPLPRTSESDTDTSQSDSITSTIDTESPPPAGSGMVQTCVVDAIKTLNEKRDYSNGVPLSDIVEEVTGEDITREECESAVIELKRKGRIYSASQNKIKLT